MQLLEALVGQTLLRLGLAVEDREGGDLVLLLLQEALEGGDHLLRGLLVEAGGDDRVGRMVIDHHLTHPLKVNQQVTQFGRVEGLQRFIPQASGGGILLGWRWA